MTAGFQLKTHPLSHLDLKCKTLLLEADKNTASLQSLLTYTAILTDMLCAPIIEIDVNTTVKTNVTALMVKCQMLF